MKTLTPRQRAALALLAKAAQPVPESVLRRSGRLSFDALMELLRHQLVRNTTLGDSAGFDNAFYDHAYAITARGRAVLKAEVNESRGAER